MLEEIILLTKKLISIESISGNTKALDEILEVALSYLKEYTIERFENNGTKSALIYNSEKRPKKFKIILNGHLDVVPGKKSQYSPKIKDSRIYGVGSMDMKANVACLIMIFKEMADKVNYPLGLQLVTDEEIGGFNGTKYQIDKGVRTDFVIAGEPTHFDIVNEAKGVLQVKISVKGKTAHSAYPWKGENAIYKMNEFLNNLQKKYPIPDKEKWITTVNVGKIETGNQVFNKIPDNCVVSLDIRYIPEEANTIISDIKKLLPKGFTINIITNESIMFTNSDNEYIKILRGSIKKVIKKSSLRGAHGSSDARYFTKINCAGIEFGPIGGDIGGDSEWVNIPSLEKYCQILKDFLLSLV